MKETYISTREVSNLLNVTETTIKRWTDSGGLKCIKTLGGHRKYLLKDIEEFATENNILITGVTPPLRKDQMEKLGFAVYSKNMSLAIDIIQEEAQQGDREGIFEMLMYLVKNRIKFIDIVDEIIQPAMKRLGDLWERGKIDVEQEHLASGTIETALSRLVVYLPRQKERNIKILCACSEGDVHDLGLQLLGYELELSGYTLYYLGANTPFKSVIKAIKKERPDYVFLSATAPSITEEEFINGIRSVVKNAKGTNSKVAAGGRYVQDLGKHLPGCEIVNSLKETMTFIKTNKQ